ncbi:MAG: hypothetical protein R2744_08880 [Bacteroidales bacterium]
MCGRCEIACPVGIELGPLRMIQRRAGETPNDMKAIWSGFMRERNQDYLSDRAGKNLALPYGYLEAERRLKKQGCSILQAV